MKSTLVAAFTSFSLVIAGCSSDDDTAQDDNAQPQVDAGSSSTGTLYERLGGHTGIRGAIDAIVTEELKDPEIASFFALVGTPGHPTADQIGECFTNLLGKVAGGPEVYPTTVNGFTCRDMRASHTALHIPAATFDKFVVVAAGVLRSAGVSDADITTIGGVLNGTKSDIVDPMADSN